MKLRRLRLEALESRDVPASFLVTTTATTGAGSLGEAIDLANVAPDADTITFAVTGAIKAPFQFGPIYPTPAAAGFDIKNDLTITGPGAGLLSIQGDASYFPGPLAFWVESGVHAQISGLSVQSMKPGGSGVGAITNYGTLALDQVVISNVAGTVDAGGIYSTGTLTVTNSIFRDNSVGFYLAPSAGRPPGGGAILMRGGQVTVSDSLFERNSAYWSGGAISASLVSGSLTIDGCTFSGNSAATNTFQVRAADPGNYASGRLGGGAVYAELSTVTITNSTFKGNTSGVAGGAIQLASGATALLTNVTITGNSAQAGAGTTTADVWGGGIGLGAAPAPVLRNTIVAGNILSAPSSANVLDDYTGSLGTGSVNNLIGANPAGAIGNGQNGNMVGTRTAPIDPLLDALSNNGGPTPTMMPLSGSPAIDHGNNSAATGLSTDQRGGSFVRIFNGTVDIGAVEVQPPPPPAAAPGAILAGGAPNGTAFVLNQTAGVYSNAGTATFFPGFAGTVRTASADVNGDGTPDYIGGGGPGGGPRVTIIDGANGSRLADFFAFEMSFLGGVFVAAADFDLDGRGEVIVTPDQGGGPRVEIFSFTSGSPVVRANFFGIDDPNFRGGARAGTGDVNGDGTPDLAVCAGFLGGPRTALFNGTTLFTTPTRLVGDFFAFPGIDATTLRNGVFVAAGDVNGDGFDDLIFGGGPGGAPRVFILSGQQVSAGNVAAAQANPIANFFVAGNVADRGGVRLAAKDADGDAKADVVAGSGEGSPANVRIYLGKNFTGNGEPGTFQDISVFGGLALTDGVFVG